MNKIFKFKLKTHLLPSRRIVLPLLGCRTGLCILPISSVVLVLACIVSAVEERCLKGWIRRSGEYLAGCLRSLGI